MSDVIPDNWRKSSYSSGGQGQCVEVAGGDALVGVRDSKDRSGGTLAFGTASWTAFLANVRAGRFGG